MYLLLYIHSHLDLHFRGTLQVYYIFEEAQNNRISAPAPPLTPTTSASEVQSPESHHLEASISSESSVSRPTSAAMETDDEEEEDLPEGMCVCMHSRGDFVVLMFYN